MKKLIYLLILGYLITVLAGCGSPSPAASNSGTTNVSITKYTVAAGTITPSVNNPFTNNVSVPSFVSPQTATLITLVKTAAPAAGATFTETISTSSTATYAAYQAVGTINNITGKNGISGLAQAASAYNNPFTGEEMLRQSEAQLLKQGGSFTKKSSALAGLNALGNATPDASGTVNNFWVNAQFNGQLSGDVQVTATCLYVGSSAYIYVDNTTPASTTTYTPANLAAMSATFDAIYATDRLTFGSEYKPGIDGDDRVTILISPKVNSVVTGLLGYFWGRDEFARTTGTGNVTDHSNQREMFYVIDTPAGSITPLWADASVGGPNSKQGYAVLAHEFQHMINFYHKAIVNNVVEDTWINEGLSMYAMQACGYGLPQGDATTAQHVNNYLAWPETFSLTNWTPANYGISYLYILYLVEQNGGVTVTGTPTPAAQTMLRNMVANNQTGIAQIESVTGAGTFGLVFKNWAMANLLDGQVTDPLYNYTSINLNGGVYGAYTLRVSPFPFSTYPVSGSYPTVCNMPGIGYYPNPQPGWSAAYQRFTASTAASALNVSITSGNAANNLEAVLVVK